MSSGGSVAEWLAYCTQAQKGPDSNRSRDAVGYSLKLERKYSLESTDPRESEIRAPPQPLPYLMPIPPNAFL